MAARRTSNAQQKAMPKQSLRAAGSGSRVQEETLWDSSTTRDIVGLVIAVVAIISLIAVVAPTTAPVTHAIAQFYHMGFGLGGYVLPFALLGVAALVFIRDEEVLRPRLVAGFVIIFLAIIGLLVIAMSPEYLVLGVTVSEDELARSGGYLGFAIASLLVGALGKPISCVLLVGVALGGAILLGFSLTSFIQGIRERAELLGNRRRIAVNEHPWGDDAVYADAPAQAQAFGKRNSHGSTQAGQIFDVPEQNAPSAGKTTVIDTMPTTLLEDDPLEDEDPFVDLSDQLAVEQAQTTLLDANAADSAQETSVNAIPDFLMSPKVHSNGRTANTLADSTDAQNGSKDDSTAGETTVIKPVVDNPKAQSTESNSTAASTSSAVSTEAEEENRQLPPISILHHNPKSASSASSDKELAQTAEGLQSTLQEFNLHARVVGWISGPTVTTFKIQPGEGERVSRISSLEDDIALTLAAQSVRIFAPIPGTSLVGIEIPNRKRQTVNLGDVLPYVQGGPLELAIGRDAEGLPIVADLARMPHLLIAGTTGSGKSVMINSIIVTLLMRSLPEDVRLIMVDPKRVELAGYNGLPHLYVPVVTEPKQAASALSWAVSEMERRLKIFERVGVRQIATFNEKQASGAFDSYDNPPAKMPYLVIIIDELSDLMMVAGKDVEASIVRIAQLGRAAGIHLIVATQRPSSNVVTGLIKANITNRIAFNVATGVDSRVIIDQMGAEKLTGNGDMLFSKVDWGKPKRIQGCFVSDEEINQVVEFVKNQGEADYHEEILSAVSPATLSSASSRRETSEDDPLLWEAAQIVVDSQLGSTSGLQRRLKVGYARAGRIMDMLEEKGIVGPPDGSKPREVLLDQEGLEELRALEDQMAQEDGLGGF